LDRIWGAKLHTCTFDFEKAEIELVLRYYTDDIVFETHVIRLRGVRQFVFQYATGHFWEYLELSDPSAHRVSARGERLWLVDSDIFDGFSPTEFLCQEVEIDGNVLQAPAAEAGEGAGEEVSS
jgi:hypothetical protein